MSVENPVPTWFGVRYVFRYVMWIMYTNPVTILATLQALFQAATLNDTLFSKTADHWIAIGALALTVLVAQVKKNSPPTSPPINPKGPIAVPPPAPPPS
jgi:hypothetical protein